MKTLQIVFYVGGHDDKTASFSLVSPKDDITKAEVDAWTKKVIDKKAIMIGTVPVTGVKETYVKEVTITQLA